MYTNGLTGRRGRKRPSLSRKICGSDKAPSLVGCSYSARLNKDAIWCYYMSWNDKTASIIASRICTSCLLLAHNKMAEISDNLSVINIKKQKRLFTIFEHVANLHITIQQHNARN